MEFSLGPLGDMKFLQNNIRLLTKWNESKIEKYS